MHMLHRDLLLALAAVAIERIEQRRISAGEFVGLAQILAPAPEGLFKKHGPSIAFHRGAVSSDKLGPDHALDLVFRADPSERGPRRFVLTISRDALGLAFQQVQKYENGTNRIGASRLQQISHILRVPVAFFFEGAPNLHGSADGGMKEAPSPAYVSDLLATSEGLSLTKAFMRIKDAKLRRRIVDLVEGIAGDNSH